MSATIQLRAKSTLTIPAEICERYGFAEGDVFTLVDLGDGRLLLAPRVSVVPKLVAEIEAMRIEAGLSVNDMLAELPAIRRDVYRERHGDGG